LVLVEVVVSTAATTKWVAVVVVVELVVKRFTLMRAQQ
jgi:hypothetical protein